MALLLNALRVLFLAPPVFDAPARERAPEESGAQPAARPELGEYRAPDLLKERRGYTENRPWKDCTVFVLATEKGHVWASCNKDRVVRAFRDSQYYRQAYAIEEIFVSVPLPGMAKQLLDEGAELLVTETAPKERKPSGLEDGVRKWAEHYLVRTSTGGRLSAVEVMDAYNLWAGGHDCETTTDPGAFGRAMTPILAILDIAKSTTHGRTHYVNCEIMGQS